jgi:hypothetical protein
MRVVAILAWPSHSDVGLMVEPIGGGRCTQRVGADRRRSDLASRGAGGIFRNSYARDRSCDGRLESLENVVRTVTENSRTPKFTTQGFEEESGER